MGLRNTDPLKSTRSNQFIWTQTFVTNSTSAPDGLDPDLGSDCAIAYSTTGTWTLTFSGLKKPLEMCFGSATVLGDKPGIHAKVVSYVPATGVMTVKLYDEDNVSGIEAAATVDDITIQMLCVFRNSAGVSE